MSSRILRKKLKSRETGMAEHHPEWQSEEDGAWWPKGGRGKKGSSKGKIASLKVVVGLPTQKRVHAVISTRTKAEARNEEERRKKVLILNWISQPHNHPVKRRIVISRESYDWYDGSSVPSAVHSTPAWYGTGHTARMASLPLNLANHPTYVVQDLGCTQSIGSRTAIRSFQEHALYYGITTEIWPCNKSFVFANSDTETCFESCIIHFPTTPPRSTRVDAPATGDVHILFSPSQMKKLGTTIELDPKGDKITCPAFGLYCSLANYSMMEHIVLDLTSLIKAKISESSSHTRTGRR